MLRSVEYNIDVTAATMKLDGFDAHFYQLLYTGLRIGGGTSTILII